jgi:hypothetical protein
MAQCGATTADGTPCRRPVKRHGQRCYQHKRGSAPRLKSSPRKRATATAASSRRGSGSARRKPSSRTRRAHRPSALAAFASPASAPPRQRQASPPPSRRAQESERVRKAAVFCADSLSDGWQEAVADRATDYAQTAWERLSRSRRKRNCKALARIARSILAAKAQIHRLIGKLVGWAAGALGAGGAARAFTEELAANIPIGPVDAKMIAVARGVQIAGILLCVMDGRDLEKCECFRDLALAETKERVKQILMAGMSDWTNLARFRPQAAR